LRRSRFYDGRRFLKSFRPFFFCPSFFSLLIFCRLIKKDCLFEKKNYEASITIVRLYRHGNVVNTQQHQPSTVVRKVTPGTKSMSSIALISSSLLAGRTNDLECDPTVTSFSFFSLSLLLHPTCLCIVSVYGYFVILILYTTVLM